MLNVIYNENNGNDNDDKKIVVPSPFDLYV